jgi:PAS domain S-box-containing protein
MNAQKKTLWELLWDYDPNGLLVVDTDLKITLVNSALCAMFRTTAEAIIGQPVSEIVDDADEFLTVWQENRPVKAREKHYPALDLHVRKVMFPIRDEGIIACIMVDVTHELQQREELLKLKRETIQRVGDVINNQMRVAHEIASLLGETTAESKVSLLKLVEMLAREGV